MPTELQPVPSSTSHWRIAGKSLSRLSACQCYDAEMQEDGCVHLKPGAIHPVVLDPQIHITQLIIKDLDK